MRRGALFFAIALVAVCAQVFAYDWSTNPGDGSLKHPYQISEPNHLMSIGSDPNLLDKYYILTNDITFDPNNNPSHVFDRALIASDTDINTPDFQGIPFTGSLNGNGFQIKNLMISYLSGDFIGLFGKLETGAAVFDLGIVNYSVTGNGGNCGGLCGLSYASISHCYSMGTLVGNANCGGLVGTNYGNINNCYSNSDVIVNNRSAGGLVGFNLGNISNCYTKGNTDGDFRVGGLVGNSYYFGSIIHSYSVSKVTGNSQVGGLTGGHDLGDIKKSYFLNTAGPDNGLGIPLTDVQLRQQSSFDTWDFIGETNKGTSDYWSILPGEYPRLHFFADDFDYYDFSGNGTKESPYLVMDANDLGAVWQYPDKYYRLENTIDLSEINWSSAIVPFILGCFDGNKYVISNMKIQGIGDIGLFGNISATGVVSSLDLYDCILDGGNGTHIGSMTGVNCGEIINCSITGNVTGFVSVGGLTGHNLNTVSSSSYIGEVLCSGQTGGGLIGYNLGDVVRCYSICEIDGYSTIGGLVGGNRSIINNSYSISTVSGITYIGGLVGNNQDGSVTYCYSAGTVVCDNWASGGLVGGSGSATESYFLETAGPDNGYGTPLSDPNMMIQDNFVGWDFVDDGTDGLNNIWRMCVDGIDYPRLLWEFAQNGDFACGDGVGLGDLQALAEHWLLVGTAHPTLFNYACDANGDEVINLQDFRALSENWP